MGLRGSPFLCPVRHNGRQQGEGNLSGLGKREAGLRGRYISAISTWYRPAHAVKANVGCLNLSAGPYLTNDSCSEEDPTNVFQKVLDLDQTVKGSDVSSTPSLLLCTPCLRALHTFSAYNSGESPNKSTSGTGR